MASAQIAILAAGALIAAFQAWVSLHFRRQRKQQELDTIAHARIPRPIQPAMRKFDHDFSALEVEPADPTSLGQMASLFVVKRKNEDGDEVVTEREKPGFIRSMQYSTLPSPDPSGQMMSAIIDLKTSMIAESRKAAVWGFFQNFAFFLMGLAASYYLQ